MLLSLVSCVFLYLCTVCGIGQSFLVDDSPTSSSPSFQLTFSPSVVKRGLTHNVSLVCEHDGKTLSQLQKVSMIKIIKQTPAGWDLVAARTISNTTSRIADRNVFVTGAITQNTNDAFLEISWAVAEADTFGTYRCDVIGVSASESSTTIDLVEAPATAGDVLDLLLQTREEISELSRDINRHLDAMDRDIDGLKEQALTQKSVAAWPEGSFALLQPRAGCPVDLTFLGGDASYFVVHTESSSDAKNGNSYSKAMPLSTVTKLNGHVQLFTLRFCEARREFSTRRWPGGSYCIHKIPGKVCPSGFDAGSVTLDAEDTNTTSDLRGNVVQEFGDRAKLEFCCRNSGSSSYRMHLPTDSPFLLYRKGNKCQPVYGMRVSEESITIDTEDNNNGDTVSGAVPDVFLLTSTGKPVRFALCYYTKE